MLGCGGRCGKVLREVWEGVLGCEGRYGERCGGDVGKCVGVWGR